MEAKKGKEEARILMLPAGLGDEVRIKALDVVGFIYGINLRPGNQVEYNIISYRDGERKVDWFTQAELSFESEPVEVRRLGL